MKKGNLFVDMIGITLATTLVAASVYFFLIPSDLPLGSISGLAMLLSKVIPLSMATLTMILNVSLLIIGFILLGREFGIKTVYTSILLPAVMGIFEKFFPNPTSLIGDVMSDLLVFSLFVSIGQAILFNLNASSGGLDIVTKILNRFFHIDMGKAAIWSGMIVAGSTVFFYDVRTAVLSIFGTYLSGVVLDHFIFGFNERK
ncbi:MAG: YitT family protein, partial [Clostridia bacterium]|nr:YitT family protein [Clostridia bacterium]